MIRSLCPANVYLRVFPWWNWRRDIKGLYSCSVSCRCKIFISVHPVREATVMHLDALPMMPKQKFRHWPVRSEDWNVQIQMSCHDIEGERDPHCRIRVLPIRHPCIHQRIIGHNENQLNSCNCWEHIGSVRGSSKNTYFGKYTLIVFVVTSMCTIIE